MQYESREPIVLSNENQKIFGIIHRPLNSQFSPAILMCHGLAGNKIGRYRSYVTAATELVKKGFTVLRFDYRGSGDSEGELSEMTLMGAVSDTLVGLNYLKQDPFVDSDRIGLFGRSFGGAVALLAASKFLDIKSIALWAPIYHTKEWEEKWKHMQASQVSQEKIDEFKRVNGQLLGKPFWTEIFAMDLSKTLSKLEKIPLLHIHGEKDAVVPINHAVKYREARNQAKGTTNFILLPTADHDFSSAINQKTAIEETVAWFENTL